jgi:hypothetical protein
MPPKFVSEDEIRQMFNEGRYFERVQSGELRAVTIGQNRPKRKNRQVRGAKSETVDYLDEYGRRVARVHQYRNKDGALGGSGKPDPKVLFHNGTLYILDEGPDWDLPELPSH